MKAGKIWGQTKVIKANSSFELHRISIKAGTHCSKHKHTYKFNGFYVISGQLAIDTWKNDYDLIDTTILGPDDYTEVKPGEYHQFRAITDVEAIEAYWVELDHDDIIRESVGGRDENA